jgi:Putative transposase
MTLAPAEFIRRFLLHVLPDGFQRIRHYGFLANGNRTTKLARIRRLLPSPRQQEPASPTQHSDTATRGPEGAAASTTGDNCS